jgi:predicted AAA+ superfamily ATPase
MEFVSRFFDAPAGSFFLLGPRGTGKSMWTRHAFSGALVIDLLDPATERRLLARPELLAEMVQSVPTGGVVVLDEIQKVPALLDVVHRLIEQRRRWRFVLTGSSARKLRRGGVNLLGGRAAATRMVPYMAAERGRRFSLAEALSVGLVPSVIGAADPLRARDAYAALYVREEVQAERLVRNVGDFARFLEAVSFSHGALLNLANVARECGVERKTVEGYLAVLEDLLLAERLPPFTKRAKRDLVAHPKFYYFDAGVYRSLRPSGPLDRPAEIDGAALEGLVHQHLTAWTAWTTTGRHTVSFWRSRAGREVDFVVYGPTQFVAVEVKNTAVIRGADLSGLRAFGDDYPEATRLMLYRGQERLVIDGVTCAPVEEFLRRLHPSRGVADAAAWPSERD